MSRELTRQEKTAIRKLVTKWCANYDKDAGCLPLLLGYPTKLSDFVGKGDAAK